MEDKIIDYLSQTPENTNPAVLHTLLGDLNKQPDWNQNDSTAADYIKNRPFYEEITEVVMLPETSFECVVEGGNIGALLSTSFPYTFEIGKEYTVTLDGVTNTCTSSLFEGEVVAITNTSLEELVKGNGYACFAVDNALSLLSFSSSLLGTHTIKIGYPTTITHKVDSKYIDSGSLGLEPLILYTKQM